MVGQRHAVEISVIELEVVLVDHALAIVAQEYVVGNDVRAYFQLNHRLLLLRGERSTVAAHEDGAVDDGRMVFVSACQTDGHLLGIGTEGIEGFIGGLTALNPVAIVEVAKGIVVGHARVVGVGIGSIAAAIHIAEDLCIDAHGIAAIDGARHVIAAIDIDNVSAAHQRSCRQLVGELVAGQVHARGVLAVHGRHHVGHTTASVEVLDFEGGIGGNFKEQALGTGHVAAVTAAIQVAHLAGQQVPRRPDGHLGLVVAAEEASHLVFATTGLGEGGVDAHLLETCRAEQVHIASRHLMGLRRLIGRIGRAIGLHAGDINQDVVHHLAGVVDVDDGLLLHRGVVAATVGIDDGAADDLQIGLVELGQLEAHVLSIGHHLGYGCGVVLVGRVVDAVRHLAGFRSGCLLVVVVAVAAGEELAYVHLLGIAVRHPASGLGAHAHIAVERVVDNILLGFRIAFFLHCRQFFRLVLAHCGSRSDGAGDVVAAEHLVDQDIVGSRGIVFREVFAVDVYVGVAADVGHARAAEHLTLRVDERACER